MQAIVLHETGPKENLKLEDIDRPTATPGHVVLKVHACGVSYRDIVDRRGGFAFIQTPIVLGHEFAGEVVEVGEGVTGWSVGDRAINLYRNHCGVCAHCRGGDERQCKSSWEVFGLTTNGGYAEYTLVGEYGLERLPDDISYEVGATVMSAAAVGYHNTVNTAGVRPGETVLITGATGGVGAYALQSAKIAGATVWAVTSSESKSERLRELGADLVIVNDDGTFHKEVGRLTDGDGIDAVIENVGAPTFNASVRSVRRGGRVVVVGNIDGKRVDLNLGRLIVNAVAVLGSDGVSRAAIRDVFRLLATGQMKPMIAETVPLADAVRAHGILEDRGAFGRIVLVPSHGS